MKYLRNLEKQMHKYYSLSKDSPTAIILLERAAQINTAKRGEGVVGHQSAFPWPLRPDTTPRGRLSETGGMKHVA